MKRLTEQEMAERWDITPRTLQNWRATWEDPEAAEKLGPPFIRVGKRSIVYREEDVLAYEEASLVGSRAAPHGWDSTVKRAAGALDVLAKQAKTPKAKQTLSTLRDELRALIS